VGRLADIKLSDPTISQASIEMVIRYLYSNDSSDVIRTTDPEVCDQLLRMADFLQLNSSSSLVSHCTKILISVENDKKRKDAPPFNAAAQEPERRSTRT
jgi:hypothetical protein